MTDFLLNIVVHVQFEEIYMFLYFKYSNYVFRIIKLFSKLLIKINISNFFIPQTYICFLSELTDQDFADIQQ